GGSPDVASTIGGWFAECPPCECGDQTEPPRAEQGPMDEAMQVSHLIGEIYDAALDKALWPPVLEKTCRFLPGACAGLTAQDMIAGSGQFYFSWGLDPDYERSYLEKYIKLNTAGMIALCSTPPGDVFCTETLMPYEEFL